MNLHPKLLPAILNAEQATEYLGLKKHDTPILIKFEKPLGNPAKNGEKLFAREDIIKLGSNPQRLNKLIRAKQKYWKQKSLRRKSR